MSLKKALQTAEIFRKLLLPNSITADYMKCLLQSCQAQHHELTEEWREHQKQLEWERKRQEEQNRIQQEVCKKEGK